VPTTARSTSTTENAPKLFRVFFFTSTSSASSSTRFMYSSKPCELRPKAKRTHQNYGHNCLRQSTQPSTRLCHKLNGYHTVYSPKCDLPLVSLPARTAKLEYGPAVTQKREQTISATMPQNSNSISLHTFTDTAAFTVQSTNLHFAKT
jgi:hypothetical protein